MHALDGDGATGRIFDVFLSRALAEEEIATDHRRWQGT
jgi:hypothetical protein